MASVSLGFSFVGSLSSVFLRGFATIFLVPHNVDHTSSYNEYAVETMSVQFFAVYNVFLNIYIYITVYIYYILLLVFLFSDRIEFIAMARAQCCCS